jgi:DNA-directed RNA polymerase specialized sigma24 family protein
MTAQHTEIEYLIQGCKAGERKAQHELYKYFYEFAMRIALRYSRDDADAADILSHAFVEFLKVLRTMIAVKVTFMDG